MIRFLGALAYPHRLGPNRARGPTFGSKRPFLGPKCYLPIVALTHRGPLFSFCPFGRSGWTSKSSLLFHPSGLTRLGLFETRKHICASPFGPSPLRLRASALDCGGAGLPAPQSAVAALAYPRHGKDKSAIGLMRRWPTRSCSGFVLRVSPGLFSPFRFGLSWCGLRGFKPGVCTRIS